jgi:hypothetical protein
VINTRIPEHLPVVFDGSVDLITRLGIDVDASLPAGFDERLVHKAGKA